MKVKRFLLLEPNCGGHHFASYLRFVARGMLLRGWQPIVVTTESSAGSPARRLLDEEFGDALMLRAFGEIDSPRRGSRLGLLANQFRSHQWHRRAVRAATREWGVDGVLVMGFDGIARAAGLIGLPTHGLATWSISIGIRYHWPSYGLSASRRSDLPSRWLIERAISRPDFKALFTIDPTYAEYAHGAGGRMAERVIRIPDPGELAALSSARAARLSLGLDAEAFVILVYGSITLGKGLEQLIQILSRLRERGEPVQAVLAGNCDRGALDLLRAPLARELLNSGTLVVRDSYKSSAEEALLFSASHVVWVAYSRGFLKPSAVMSQACQAAIPVLARPSGLIGRSVERHGHGLLLDPDVDDKAATRIASLMHDDQAYSDLCSKADAMAEDCNSTAFSNKICDVIEQTSDGLGCRHGLAGTGT